MSAMQTPDIAVAIVGMAGRFPGAGSVDELWGNVVGGVRSIRDLSDGELRGAGVSEQDLNDAAYVKAGAPLAGIEEFDAGFFGYPPREAEVMDPQHRLFLECAWQALEHAGYDPTNSPGLVGTFAGSAFPGYLLHNLAATTRRQSTSGTELQASHRERAGCTCLDGLLQAEPAGAGGSGSDVLLDLAGGHPPGLSKPVDL